MVDTMTKATYKAFGMVIESEIPLPELKEYTFFEESYHADIDITIADLTERWNEIGIEGKFIVKEKEVLFHIKNTAIFGVLNGNSIIVSPSLHADYDKIRLYVLGTCMGILLMQRRILPLHGSAVVIDGKAYAIVGESGAGKSTLAATFIDNGYPLLSDDVIALSHSLNGEITVAPSYPQQKLWEESLKKLEMHPNEFKPLFERETKYAIPVASNFYDGESLPLAGVFELVKSEQDSIELTRIDSRLEKLPILLHHTYRNSFLKGLNLLEWHFDMTAKCAHQLEVYRVKRPLTKFTPFELQSLLLKTIKGDLIDDEN
ncbi:ATP-binding cassette domain-containing protein [Bacillus spongiae]|uniref:ATP-binding cassette domain-containing protein n=1 Tax=Bacillus spongiae TaxID=2683610 RepID=A0ABU8HF17_9BACI